MRKYLFLFVFFNLSLHNKSQTISDVDGNTYNTVTIGTQKWMKENLKTTKYNDGANIPNVTDSPAWNNLTSPAYCWYNNNTANKAVFGALYNWYTVNTGKLCPVGWRVPMDTDWVTLEANLGGSQIAGGKMKEAGTAHWLSPNTGADNSSGFTALPAGYRMGDGTFSLIYMAVFWWSYVDTLNIQTRYVQNDLSYLGNSFFNMAFGISVRCIKDINIPAAPTSVIVDDEANTFDWTNNPDYTAITDYEFSVDKGASWATCTTKPLNVGNVSIAAGDLIIRVKSTATAPAGEPLASTAEFTINTGIENVFPSSMLLYPNPVRSKLIITLNEHKPDATIGFYSLSGGLLFQAVLNTNTTEIDFGMFAAGIYIFKVITSKVVFSGYIIKQ